MKSYKLTKKAFFIMLITGLLTIAMLTPTGVYATEEQVSAVATEVVSDPKADAADPGKAVSNAEAGTDAFSEEDIAYQTFSEGDIPANEDAETPETEIAVPLSETFGDASSDPVVTAEEAEVFSGNAIGRWLDKTFYAFDYAIFTVFGGIHTAILTTFFNLYTHLGDSEFAIPMILLGLILSLFKKTRKYGLTLFLAIIIGTLFTNVVLKNVCGRCRPYVTLAGNSQFMNWYAEAGSNIESDNSFPSGHTTCAFEIATALFITIKNKKVRWIFPVYAILIMCSRIYLMVHYPTDVLAGVIVGIAAGILGYIAAKAIMKIKFVDKIDLGKKKKA